MATNHETWGSQKHLNINESWWFFTCETRSNGIQPLSSKNDTIYEMKYVSWWRFSINSIKLVRRVNLGYGVSAQNIKFRTQANAYVQTRRKWWFKYYTGMITIYIQYKVFQYSMKYMTSFVTSFNTDRSNGTFVPWLRYWSFVLYRRGRHKFNEWI